MEIGALAQLGECHTGSVDVSGSSPLCSTIFLEEKMKQLLFVFFILTVSLFATDMVIEKIDGTIENIPLSEISNISFSETHIEPIERILFIGNSITYYNGGVDFHLQELVNAEGGNLLYCNSITQGGATLENHWNNPSVHLEIANGNYDIVVLQERTSWPVDNPELFYEYATRLDSLITASGSETVIFFSPPYRSVFDEMIAEQTIAFEHISDELDVMVVQVARAWQLSIAQNSNLELYMQDGNHPNNFGTYLNVCTFYAYLWQSSPVGFEYVNDAEIDAVTREFLQQIAWDTFLEMGN